MFVLMPYSRKSLQINIVNIVRVIIKNKQNRLLPLEKTLGTLLIIFNFVSDNVTLI